MTFREIRRKAGNKGCGSVVGRIGSFQAIVRHYVSNHRDKVQAELVSFQTEQSLSQCIRRAACAQQPDGKRLKHQRRIPAKVLDAWARALCREENQIRSSRTFEALIEMLNKESKQFWKNGELTVYDTALRIGAYLHLEPRVVFLHRGTRDGARVLGFDGARPSVRPHELPREFRQLRPHEIEDCLCIYKNHLAGRLKR